MRSEMTPRFATIVKPRALRWRSKIKTDDGKTFDRSFFRRLLSDERSPSIGFVLGRILSLPSYLTNILRATALGASSGTCLLFNEDLSITSPFPRSLGVVNANSKSKQEPVPEA